MLLFCRRFNLPSFKLNLLIEKSLEILKTFNLQIALKGKSKNIYIPGTGNGNLGTRPTFVSLTKFRVLDLDSRIFTFSYVLDLDSYHLVLDLGCARPRYI